MECPNRHDLVYQKREGVFLRVVHFFPELNGKRGIILLEQKTERLSFMYFCYELPHYLYNQEDTKWRLNIYREKG